MAKAFFISDAHISGPDDPAYARLLSFVDHVRKESGTHLFMIGDVFEFLHGRGTYVMRRYAELFDRLRALSGSGVKVYYLYGNHDFNFRLSLDLAYSGEKIDGVDIDGLNCLVFHGDGLDPKDTKYRLLKSVVRSRVFDLLARLTPDPVLYWLAGFFSGVSRGLGRQKMINDNRFLCYRSDALQRLASGTLDVVVYGHTHVPDLSRIASEKGGYKYYINPGYFGRHGTYGLIEKDTVYIGVFDNRMLL